MSEAPVNTDVKTSPPLPAPAGKKRPDPTGSKIAFKRARRFNNPDKNVTSYQSTPLPTSIVIQPIQAFFRIHTSPVRLVTFIKMVYDVIVSRDHKFENRLSKNVLVYVSLLAFYYRLISVGIAHGYFFPSYSITKLKQAVTSLLLPDAICQAIECIGKITLPDGKTLVPHVPTQREIKESAEHIVPKISTAAADVRHPLGEENIDIETIVKYVMCTTRGVKSNILFRKLNLNNTDGRLEFSVARETTANGCVARATYQMEEALAHLGAAYGFRDLETESSWCGPDNKYLSYAHQSTHFDPDLFVVTKIATDPLPSK